MLKPLADASDRALAGVALVRIDLNAADDWRLRAALPTIAHLKERARKVVLIGHKGRPKPGGRLGKLSLWGDAQRLAELLGDDVHFVTDTTVAGVRKSLASVPDGGVALLENIRAFKGEASDSAAFAQQLASLGDYYVSEAFPVLHHPAASVTGLPRLMPSYAGFRLVEELERLGKLQGRVRRPYVVVIGGAKAQDKLGVLAEVIGTADKVLVGGACANALLALSGAKVGSSTYERDPKLLAALKPYVGHRKIVLPTDFVRGEGKILDIGPKTARAFAREVGKAGTVLWAGPLGMIERARFAHGTRAVARAVARNKRAFSVTGGGETVSFLKAERLDRGFSFISTGGGAMLDLVSGKELPGVRALSGRRAPAPRPTLSPKAAAQANLAALRETVAPRIPKLAPAYDLFFHNDFDGYASAAVFLDFFKQHKRRVGRFVACEYGSDFDELWLKRDGLARYAGTKRINPAVLVDFRYHPQAAFWYDNHATSFSKEEWERDFQPDAAHQHDLSYISACHLSYDMLVRHYGYRPSAHVKELVRWADVIDGARYADPYQTIAMREPALRINAALGELSRELMGRDATKPVAMPWLAELLATKSLEAIARDRRIAPVAARLRQEAKETLAYYRRHSTVRGTVVVTDMTAFEGRRLRYAPFYLAPDVVYSIVLSAKPDRIIGQVGVSPWKRERNAFNIGAMMTKFGGGGHPYVGVMRFFTRAEADRAVEHLVSLFNGAVS